MRGAGANGGPSRPQDRLTKGAGPVFHFRSAGGATGRLHLQTRGCKFVKFQEIKIQEEADQAGSPPPTTPFLPPPWPGHFPLTIPLPC